MRFELGKGHFDGVEIGAVRRQEEEPRATLFEDGFGFLALVARQIVENDHVPAPERWGQLGLDISFEDLPVHRTVDNPRGGQAVVAECSDERLRPPMTKGSLHFQSLASSGSTTQPCHLGRCPGLIDKDQPFRVPRHPRLAVHLPHTPGTNNISAIGFARQQRFF